MISSRNDREEVLVGPFLKKNLWADFLKINERLMVKKVLMELAQESVTKFYSVYFLYSIEELRVIKGSTEFMHLSYLRIVLYSMRGHYFSLSTLVSRNVDIFSYCY